MSNILRQKSIKSVEWTLEANNELIPYISEDFFFQDLKCHLRFKLGAGTGRSYPTSRLYFKSNRQPQSPVKISVRVTVAPEIIDPHFVTEQEQIITCKEQLIWSYSTGRLYRTIVTFEVVTSLDTSKADRSVQTATYLNANIAMGSLTEDFSRLLETGLDHDVVMKCEGHCIKAHKIVLSTRSEVFKAMLQSKMLEGQTGQVEIRDMDPNSFRSFIRYLYTDVLPEMCLDMAKTLYEVGDKYAVRSLLLRCSEYLQDNVSPENVFQCFVLADAHSDKLLKHKIINFILGKKLYLQDEHWLPFCNNFPKTALVVYRLSYKLNERT